MILSQPARPFRESAAQALKNQIVAVASLVLLSLLIRLFFLWVLTGSGTTETAGDAVRYMDRAVGYTAIWNSLLQRQMPSPTAFAQAYSSVQAPLYSVILSFMFLAFGSDLFYARLATIVLSAFTVPLVYLTTSQLSNRRTALWAALIFLLYPGFIHFSLRPFSETLFIFVAYLVVLVLLQIIHARTLLRMVLGALLTGALIGVATLVRAVGLIWIPVAACWLATQIDRRHRWLVSGLVVLSALVTLLPWEIVLYRVEGRLLIVTSSGDPAFYLPAGLIAPLTDTTPPAQPDGVDNELPTGNRLERGIGDWQRLTVPDFTLYRYLLTLGIPPLNGRVLGIFLAGMLLAFLVLVASALWGLLLTRPVLRHRSLLIALAGSLVGMYLLTHGQARFNVPVLALLVPAAAHGIRHARRIFRPRYRVSALAFGACCAVLLVSVAGGVRREWQQVVPSSHYAPVARALDSILGTQVTLRDRVQFRMSSSGAPEAVQIALDSFRFSDGDSIRWLTSGQTALDATVLSQTAQGSVQFLLSTSNSPEPIIMRLRRSAWHSWLATGIQGVQYRWIENDTAPFDLPSEIHSD